MENTKSIFISLSLMFIGIFFWVMFFNQLVTMAVPLFVLLVQGLWAVYVVFLDLDDGTD